MRKVGNKINKENRNMCKTCGCCPCKCGKKIVNGVCEGCGKPYDDCTCKSEEKAGE